MKFPYDPRKLRLLALKMVAKQQPGASATQLCQAAEYLIHYIDTGEHVIRLRDVPRETA